MNQTLGDQLRNNLSVAERRRDDASQLAEALSVGAQLADQVDRLLAENAELKRALDRLAPVGDSGDVEGPRDGEPNDEPA